MNLRLFAVDGVPTGVQILGIWHGDEKLIALCRWIAQEFFPQT